MKHGNIETKKHKNKKTNGGARCFYVFMFLCFFVFALFPTPARAQECPSGGFWVENEMEHCCNYEDSPNHIRDRTEDCKPAICKKKKFDLNPGGLNYGGVCKYCHEDVVKYGDACDEICNWNCAGSDDDDGDDDFCPLPDYETDPCCGFGLEVTNSSGSSGFLNAAVTFNEDELLHAHVENLKERHYGGEEGGGGAMRKLMPPNHLYIQSEEERQRVDAEWGAWGIKTGGGSQGVIGADPFLFQLNYATDFLGRALMPPDQGGSPTSFKQNSQELCTTTPIKIDLTDALARLPNQEEMRGDVLAEGDGDLCHTPLPGPKHGACVAQESVDIPLGEAVAGLVRGVNIFPSFSFLKNIFNRTLGSGIEGEPGGFFRIFDLPGEEHEALDGETEKGNFTIQFFLSVLGLDIPIPLIKRDVSIEDKGEGGIWNTGAEAKADEGIKQKLTVPEAENGAALLRQDHGGPSVVLASTQNSITTTTRAPLDPLTPLNLSFAEKLGRTLGTWLARIITL